MARTARRATLAIWRIFAELNNSKRVRTIGGELDIAGGKHVLALFLRLGIILNE